MADFVLVCNRLLAVVTGPVEGANLANLVRRQFRVMASLTATETLRMEPCAAAVSSGYTSGAQSPGIVKSFTGLFWVHLRPVPITLAGPSAFIAVADVVLKASAPPVRRIMAGRVVARVQDEIRERVFSEGNSPSHPDRSYGARADGHLAVAILVGAPLPWPALIWSALVDLVEVVANGLRRHGWQWFRMVPGHCDLLTRLRALWPSGAGNTGGLLYFNPKTVGAPCV